MAIEVDENWGSLIGDAIQNFRAALDHLAWQLSIRENGGIPLKHPDAKNVYFPIVRSKAKWPPSKFVTVTDAAKLESVQPFNLDAEADGMGLPHPLLMMQGLSNTDKHQSIQPTSARGAVWTINGIRSTKDCVVSGTGLLLPIPGSPKVSDKVASIPIAKTGDNPDMDLDATLSSYIAVRETWNVDDVMTLIGKRVELLLSRF